MCYLWTENGFGPRQDDIWGRFRQHEGHLFPAVAIAAAANLGYPVVLKLYSYTLTHKTDVGGVRLDSDHAVRRAFDRILTSVTEKAGAEHFQGGTVQPTIRVDGYELVLGSSQDPQFGPVLVFGSGGQLVEVFQDSAIAAGSKKGQVALPF